jgi:type I restriction enzyme, S subunit
MFSNGVNKLAEAFGHGIRFVNIMDIFRNIQIDPDKLGRVEVTQSELESYKLEKGDVLLVRSSVKPEGVGYPAFFEYSYEPVVFSGFVLRFRPNPRKWDYRFLTYLLQSNTMRNNVIAYATVSANTNINQQSYKKVPVVCPPLLEQRKIASILSKVDDLIKKIDEIIEETQKLKKGLMNLLLNKGIGHTNYRKVKSIFYEFEEIPDTWDFIELERVALYSQKGAIKMGPFGSSLKKHELIETSGIKTIWIENIIDNEFNWNYRRYIAREKYQELKEFTVKPNDIVITMMGTVGRVAVIPNDIGQAIISSHLLKITLDQSKCLPKYMYYYLLSRFVEKQIMRESRGIVMGGLNTGVIKSLLVKLPPLEEQEKIVSHLSNLDSTILLLNIYKKSAGTLKKGLMQKLLTGKIRVKV